jgi:tetratricopeptide (TPR) repeat protein
MFQLAWFSGDSRHHNVVQEKPSAKALSRMHLHLLDKECSSLSSLSFDDASTDSKSTACSTLSSVTWTDESFRDDGAVALPLACGSTSLRNQRKPSRQPKSGIKKATQSSVSSRHRRYASTPSLALSDKDLLVPTLQSNLKALVSTFGRDHALVGHSWNLLGNTHFRNHEYHRALAAYKEAVLCGKPSIYLADAYANIGTVYRVLGNVDESIDFLLRSMQVHEYNAVSLGRNCEKSLPIASVHHQLGLSYTANGHLDEAALSLLRAREIREHALGTNHREVAYTIDAIGTIYHLRNDNYAALLCHKEALRIQQQASDKQRNLEREASTWCNIALVHHAMNDVHAAIFCYKSALAIQMSESLRMQAAATLTCLADLHWETGEMSVAASTYEEAKRCFEDAGLCVPPPKHPFHRVTSCKQTGTA